MKSCAMPLALLVCLALGCAHGSHPPPLSTAPSAAVGEPIAAPSDPAEAAPSVDVMPGSVEGSGSSSVDPYGDYVEEEPQARASGADPGIADPLEPFNRAMYHFNDKLYFWLLKPVAQGYRTVVPEPARVGVQNFFSNLSFPVRFVNCLLQGNVSGAASELGRFVVNTLWGIGGLLDPASGGEIQLAKQDEDFGQTLGTYGVGHGFFILWPVLGPSSPRDTVGMAGDFFLEPLSYIDSMGTRAGIRAYEIVNDTSLRIGDYESLKEAAIDPYVAVRDAYFQYRLKKVKAGGGKPVPAVSREGTSSPAVPKEAIP